MLLKCECKEDQIELDKLPCWQCKCGKQWNRDGSQREQVSNQWLDKPDKPGVWLESFNGSQVGVQIWHEINGNFASGWKYKFVHPISRPPPSPASDAEIAQQARRLVRNATSIGVKLVNGPYGSVDGWNELVELVKRK